MKRFSLRNLLFLTLCCDLGLFSKRLIAPAANILTDFLRIPGGIGTSFSLMFLVVAAALAFVNRSGDKNVSGLVLAGGGKQIEGIDGGQGAQLIVFGDQNSKRAVRYLKTISVK